MLKALETLAEIIARHSLSPTVAKMEMAERGGFEPHKIPLKITEIRTATHKETHKLQSRQAPTCPK
jgi:hypothetical protein